MYMSQTNEPIVGLPVFDAEFVIFFAKILYSYFIYKQYLLAQCADGEVVSVKMDKFQIEHVQIINFS